MVAYIILQYRMYVLRRALDYITLLPKSPTNGKRKRHESPDSFL